MAIRYARLYPIGPAGPGGTQAIDMAIPLDATGARNIYDVRAWSTVSIQAVFSPTASAAVLTVERSNDGQNFVALSSAVTLTPAAPMSATIDVSAIGYIQVRPSTADASDTATVYVLAKASD